jgi:ketosteroid isomerase-like protein
VIDKLVPRSVAVWNDLERRIRREPRCAVPASPTRVVANAFLARVAEGDPERIAELFAERVDWRLDWPDGSHPATPWIRPRSTRAEVADHFRALAAHHLPGRPGEPPTVLVDGADAVVFVELRQVVRVTGMPYAARCALRLTVADGLITRYHVYEDSLTVARAFGAGE